MGYHEQKQAWQRALIESLHGPLDEASVEPAEPEGPPNFDGGVRETPPLQGNPETDHNALLLQMFREQRGGSGADFWAMGGPPAQSGPAPEGNPNQDEGDWRKGGT